MAIVRHNWKKHGRHCFQALNMLKTLAVQFVSVMLFFHLWDTRLLLKGLNEDINCRGATALDLWQNPDDRKTARLSEFGEMIRTAFGFQVHRHQTEKPGSGHNVLFVRREDYLAHTRHGGKVQ